MKKSILINAAICAITLLGHFAQAQNTVSYTFTSFDVPFPGASNTKAFAINPRGDVVGRYVDPTAGHPRGFLRHQDGTFAPPIDVPVANTGTVPRGIDAPGDMVGKYFDSVNPNQTHGFLLSASGAFTPIDVTLDGAISGTTVANGLNNVGQIVGFYAAPTSVIGCGATLVPVPHGFLRNPDGSFTPIDFPSATATDPRAIDDTGNIVGLYVTVPSSNTTCSAATLVNVHGFIRDPKGNYTTFDAPASTGATNTFVFRSNDAGDMAGVYATGTATLGELLKDTPAPSGVPNFVLLTNGSFTSFDVIIGGLNVEGTTLGINPRGNIVGVYTDTIGDHGFFGVR